MIYVPLLTWYQVNEQQDGSADDFQVANDERRALKGKSVMDAHWRIGYVICMICMLRYKSIYIFFFLEASAPRKHSSAFVNFIICKLVKI